MRESIYPCARAKDKVISLACVSSVGTKVARSQDLGVRASGRKYQNAGNGEKPTYSCF